MRQQARHGEIVRHDDRREPEVGDEPAQQIEQPRLHRNVEPAGRLVHEDEPRIGDQVARDLQALAHAAGEGARLIVDAVLGDLDAPQPLDRGRADAAVVPVADRHHALADIGAGGDGHAQPVGRVLVHEAPVGPHQEAALGLAEVVEVAPCAVAHPVVGACPRSARSRVERQLSSVVLPEPDSPTTASTSPGQSSNPTSAQPMRAP